MNVAGTSLRRTDRETLNSRKDRRSDQKKAAFFTPSLPSFLHLCFNTSLATATRSGLRSDALPWIYVGSLRQARRGGRPAEIAEYWSGGAPLRVLRIALTLQGQ